MTDILTITLNPAVDISCSAPRVVAGPKLRCSGVLTDPAGGGLNVTRAISQLGGASTAFAAAGGTNGEKLRRLLADEGISPVVFSIPGETRMSFAVTDSSTGEQYRFVTPGPQWTDQLVEDVITAICKEISAGSIAVISGSSPPGVPDDFILRLKTAIDGKARLLVDTSGPTLGGLAQSPSGIDILRMDAKEAEGLAGNPLETRSETAAFAATLVENNAAEMVLIARGADGTTLVSRSEALHCSCPIQKIVSAVGAGDSFTGGFALCLAQGKSARDALRCGTAAASAAVLTEATQLCKRADAERLLEACEVVEL